MNDVDYNQLLVRYEEILNTNTRQKKQLALLERSREDLRKEVKRLQEVIKLLDSKDNDVYYDDEDDDDLEYRNWWD
jgi:cell division protein FtsB